VRSAAEVYTLDEDEVVAVGYSNGANIAAALFLLHPRCLRSGALLHAMVPLRPRSLPDLAGVRTLLTAGRGDAMVPEEQTEELARLLREAGAEVTLNHYPGGHELTRPELEGVREWLGEL
jgi:phospholipase/carboxylesterase